MTVYSTRSDLDNAAIFPIESITWQAEGFFHSAVSTYDCGRRRGPMHGGFEPGDLEKPVVLDLRAQLTQPEMRITAFAACCNQGGLSINVITRKVVHRVLLRTANGTVIGLGDPSCRDQQPWEIIPDGYTFAGLVSQTPAGSVEGVLSDSQWVHKLAFLAIREYDMVCATLLSYVPAIVYQQAQLSARL